MKHLYPPVLISEKPISKIILRKKMLYPQRRTRIDTTSYVLHKIPLVVKINTVVVAHKRLSDKRLRPSLSYARTNGGAVGVLPLTRHYSERIFGTSSTRPADKSPSAESTRFPAPAIIRTCASRAFFRRTIVTTL